MKNSVKVLDAVVDIIRSTKDLRNEVFGHSTKYGAITYADVMCAIQELLADYDEDDEVD